MTEKQEGKLKERSLLLAATGRLDIPLSGQKLANHNSELIGNFWRILDEAKQEIFVELKKLEALEGTYYRISETCKKWFGDEK